MQPLRFSPIYKEKVWGGRKLETLFKRALPEGLLIGESWEIADLADDVSRVADGRWAGFPLRELLKRMPEDILGSAIAGRRMRRFPLLVKLIDATDTLSVQVHPPDDYASSREGGESGKTEVWYVLHASEGSELICGLCDGVGRAQLERAFDEGDMSRCLRKKGVKEGDVIFIPAGRVHCIGKGVVLLEIQESSDITYRIHDWGREERPLHRGKACEVIDFSDRGDPVVARRWEECDGYRKTPLVECRYFRTEEYEITSGWESESLRDRFSIISVVAGDGILEYGDEESTALGRGDNLLLPSSLGGFAVRAVNGRCRLVRTEVP